jgi:hypothetical protein
MYEGTLSASFDMEEEYDRVAEKLQAEVDQLKEKKKQLQEDIRSDIASLLERRRAFCGKSSRLGSAQMDVAMDCKQALEARWKKVKEIGDLCFCFTLVFVPAGFYGIKYFCLLLCFILVLFSCSFTFLIFSLSLFPCIVPLYF